MSNLGTTMVEHQIAVDAPAAEVYQLIADVAQWPRLFSPTVHVEYLDRSPGQERIRIWAMANGEVSVRHAHSATPFTKRVTTTP